MNNTSKLYKQEIIDHYKNPRNYGDPKSKVFHTDVANYSCGDEITLGVDIDDEIIKDIKYSANGCAISIASMSLLSEFLIGKRLDDLKELKSDDVLKRIGMDKTSPRVKCGLLSLEAVKKLYQAIITKI